MGLFDDIKKALTGQNDEHDKRIIAALSSLAAEEYANLTTAEVSVLLSQGQMKRLASTFETRMWRDFNHSGAFEGVGGATPTDEEIAEYAQQYQADARFHVTKAPDSDKFYVEMVHGEVSARARIDISSTSLIIETLAPGILERNGYIEKQDIPKSDNFKEMQENNKEIESKMFNMFDKEIEKLDPQEFAQRDVVVEAIVTMEKAETMVHLDTLRAILPEDVFNELQTTIYQQKMESMPFDPEMGLTREEYNQAIDDVVSRTPFVFTLDENDNMFIQNHVFNLTEFRAPVYVEDIDCDAFLPMARDLMQSHANATNFYPTHGFATGIEVQAALNEAIQEVNRAIARAERMSVMGDMVLNEAEFKNQIEKNINEFQEKNNFDKDINEFNDIDDEEPPAGGAGTPNIGDDGSR